MENIERESRELLNIFGQAEFEPDTFPGSPSGEM